MNHKAMVGDSLEVYGDGSQTRGLIYVDDMVHAIIASATRDNVGGEVF